MKGRGKPGEWSDSPLAVRYQITPRLESRQLKNFRCTAPPRADWADNVPAERTKDRRMNKCLRIAKPPAHE
jgi:hypothetical protein